MRVLEIGLHDVNHVTAPPIQTAERAALASTPEPETLQIEKVSHLRLIERAAAQPLFKLTIRPSKAVMLTKVFRPGPHDKCLEIVVWNLEVSTNSPSRRAIAAPDVSVLVHGLDELR